MYDVLQALAFLRSHGVDLSLLTQCGGHSAARTHRPRTSSSTGIEVIKALTTAAAASGVRVLNGSRVDQIEFCRKASRAGAQACGVRLSAAPQSLPSSHGVIAASAVVIATGGFGANKSALAEYVPHLKDLPTTNGAFAQGDGIRLGLAAGGVLRDMEHVQVHPTSFIDPAAPAHPVKWLAPEALRGSGALLLDAACGRFVDELGYRSTVSDAILKFGFDRGGYKAAFMVANSKVEQLFTIAGIYKSKGFVVSHANAQAAAAAMGCDASALTRTLTTYAQPQSRDAFGKTVFPATFDANEQLLVMVVTPAVHYTIGGLSINTNACMLSAAGACVPGVFAAGEVTGGVHGNNRLAGKTTPSNAEGIKCASAYVRWQATVSWTTWCLGAGLGLLLLLQQWPRLVLKLPKLCHRVTCDFEHMPLGRAPRAGTFSTWTLARRMRHFETSKHFKTSNHFKTSKHHAQQCRSRAVACWPTAITTRRSWKEQRECSGCFAELQTDMWYYIV